MGGLRASTEATHHQVLERCKGGIVRMIPWLVPELATLLVLGPVQAEGAGAVLEVVSNSEIFTNSVLGIAVIALVYFVMLLRAELRDTRTAHRIEIAEKDKQLMELQDSRLAEAKAGIDLAKSIQSTMEAALLLANRKS